MTADRARDAQTKHKAKDRWKDGQKIKDSKQGKKGTKEKERTTTLLVRRNTVEKENERQK